MERQKLIEQRRSAGRKGGSAQVPKGFAAMTDAKRHAVSVKGGIARQEQRRKQARAAAA